MRCLLLVICLAAAGDCFAQGQPVRVREDQPWSTPAEAVSWAMLDAAQLQEHAKYVRYIWNPTGDKKASAAVSYAVNLAISHALVIKQPAIIAKGRLIRVDFFDLATTDAEARKLMRIWDEEFAKREPYFMVRSARVKVQVTPYRADDGKTYDYKYANATDFGHHADVANGRTLATLCSESPEQILQGKSCPIVRWDWFLNRVLTTLDDGLYYKFVGIEKSKKKDRTDEQEFLAQFGADEKESVEQNAVNRAAMLRSSVTGKKRRIDAFYGRAARPTDAMPIVTVTHDVFDEDERNVRFDPIRNLAEFQDRARETIAVRRNGLLAYALFNDKGELQNSVPDNIARDSTIRAPHTNRLQPAMGCLSCHGPHDGYIPFTNDVQNILKSRELRVFGDLNGKQSIEESIRILEGQYAGNLEPTLMIARNFHSTATFRATNGLMDVKDVCERIKTTNDGFQYDRVDAAAACRELGFKLTPDDDPLEMLRRRIPRLPSVNGVSPEDPLIAALRDGYSISRVDWEHVFADAALRAYATQ